jgi:hypothetical protein
MYKLLPITPQEDSLILLPLIAIVMDVVSSKVAGLIL